MNIKAKIGIFIGMNEVKVINLFLLLKYRVYGQPAPTNL